MASLIIDSARVLAEGDVPSWSDAFPNGVAAGDVTQTSAVLWARVTTTGAVRFNVQGGPTIVRAVQDPLKPVTVTVTGLTPGTRYVYTVTDRDGNVLAGTFATPQEPDAHYGLRFGVSGDWRGDLAPYPAIANMPARNLDFFVSIGDTVYADVSSAAVPGSAATLEEFYLKHDEVYREQHGLNHWAAIRATTALFATVDDHEVRNDFAGAMPAADDERFPESRGLVNETEIYRNGMQSFFDYNPLAATTYGVVGGDGRMDRRPDLYRYRTFGLDAAIFVLDARSFRDAPIAGAEELDDVPRFLDDAFAPARTLLGTAQLDRLKEDLLDAKAQGITWKFVMIPQPIQNLGFGNATDRFEGYAHERTNLLLFLEREGIDNVVFVTGDLHGYMVNDVTFREAPRAPSRQSTAIEVVTGPVAHDGTLAVRILNTALRFGYITSEEYEAYAAMDVAANRDRFLVEVVDAIHTDLGYHPVGLDDAPVQARLIKGQYMAADVYGWTEFTIDAETQQLLVTTYGVTPYTRDDVEENPEDVITRSLSVVSQFSVNPLPPRAGMAYLPLLAHPADR